MSAFFWGLIGSAGLEIVNAYTVFTHRGRLPARYKRIGFWLVRFLLAAFAGALAYAYEVDKPILAIQIGVSTPWMLQAFLKKGLFIDGEDIPASGQTEKDRKQRPGQKRKPGGAK